MCIFFTILLQGDHPSLETFLPVMVTSLTSRKSLHSKRRSRTLILVSKSWWGKVSKQCPFGQFYSSSQFLLLELVFGDDARSTAVLPTFDTTLIVETKILMHGGTVIHANRLNKNKTIGKLINKHHDFPSEIAELPWFSPKEEYKKKLKNNTPTQTQTKKRRQKSKNPSPFLFRSGLEEEGRRWRYCILDGELGTKGIRPSPSQGFPRLFRHWRVS